MTITRRDWLRTALGGAAAAAAGLALPGTACAAGAAPVKMTVYKDANCGCCKKWIDIARKDGFDVVAHDTTNLPEVKANAGVPESLQSCHTALVGGYAVEGHVPLDVVRKMLAEKPAIRGVAVPGMPAGSPGMEVPGGRQDKYDVIAFDKAGKTRVYASR